MPLILCCVLAVAHPMAAATASVLAVDINPTTQVHDRVPQGGILGFEYPMSTDGMCGWTFWLTEPATVTGLAWYEQNAAGPSHPHEVGLWQFPDGRPTNGFWGSTNSILLSSLTIADGTNASLLNGVWREADFDAPVALLAGYYMLAGTYYNQNPDVVIFVYGPPYNRVLPMDPRIIVGSPAFATPGSYYGQYYVNMPPFRIPDNILLVSGFNFGPNLLLVPSVPSLQVAARGSQIVLSWPLWATNYALETSAAIGRGASWTVTKNAAIVSGQSLVLTNPISTPSAFYRLRQR